MHKTRVIFVGILVLSLAGCSNESPRTVEYYLEHEEERTAKISECKNKAVNPTGEGVEAQNCRAAKEAIQQKFFGHKPIMKKEYKGF